MFSVRGAFSRLEIPERGETGGSPLVEEKLENGVDNDNGDDQDKVVEYDPTHRYGRVCYWPENTLLLFLHTGGWRLEAQASGALGKEDAICSC